MQTDLEERVLSALARKAVLTSTQIAERIGRRRTSVLRALSSLEQQGKAVCIGADIDKNKLWKCGVVFHDKEEAA